MMASNQPSNLVQRPPTDSSTEKFACIYLVYFMFRL
jgi:hypothetical protein